jgi:type IV secretion system protein TrbC
LGKRRKRPATGVYEHHCGGLSLVAIVVAGLTFAFGEGGSKRVLAGVLFGVGMAIAAVNFLAWLFPGN